MTKSEYVAVLKSALIAILKADITGWVVSALPFFAGGIPGQMLSVAAGKLASYMVDKGETGAFIGYIDLRTSAQGREFLKRAEDNERIKKEGTQDERIKSEVALVDSARRLLKFIN